MQAGNAIWRDMMAELYAAAVELLASGLSDNFTAVLRYQR